MDDADSRVAKLFVDASNRPKKTPRHESAIQVLMERDLTPGQVKAALGRLEGGGVLGSIRAGVDGVGDSKFYFSARLDGRTVAEEIPKKVARAARWMGRYGDSRVTRMIGEHLHHLVKAELRAQRFEIIGEKQVRAYELRRWMKTRHSLDFVARHKKSGLAIGVEVKNSLAVVPRSEVAAKLGMCAHLGVTPVFACRWMEPYRNIISERGGFLWQFYDQMYPVGQEPLASEMRRRFLLPVRVAGELPPRSIREFQDWVERATAAA